MILGLPIRCQCLSHGFPVFLLLATRLHFQLKSEKFSVCYKIDRKITFKDATPVNRRQVLFQLVLMLSSELSWILRQPLLIPFLVSTAVLFYWRRAKMNDTSFTVYVRSGLEIVSMVSGALPNGPFLKEGIYFVRQEEMINLSSDEWQNSRKILF